MNRFEWIEKRLPISLSLRYSPQTVAELPGIEGRFRDAYARRSLRQVQVVGAILVATYVVYIPSTLLFDFGPFPDWLTVLALQVFGLLVTTTFLAFSFRTHSLGSLQELTALTIFIIGVQACAVCLLFPHPFDYLALQSLVLICVAACTALCLRFLVAVLTTSALLVAFLVEAALFGRLSGDQVFLTTVYVVTADVVGGFAVYSMERTIRHDYLQEERLARERERSEQLLLNVLPAPVAARLKAGERPIADTVQEATVLFADLVGFTKLASSILPEELVERLGALFSAFDTETERLGLEKIKTIGDAYMVVAGVPSPRSDHAQACADLGLALRDVVARLNAERGWDLGVRVGIHTGPLVAGVIGDRRFSYDVWGDTVNIASRMESHGVPGKIQVSAATHARLGEGYRFGPPRELEVKGKGRMSTYFLLESPATTASIGPDERPNESSA